MRGGPKAITALLALACAGGIACGGGGGHDTVTIITRNSFPQGLLPVLGGSGRGDVALRLDGDLYFVDGSDEVKVVTRIGGGLPATFANDVGGVNNVLLSITVGFGDDQRDYGIAAGILRTLGVRSVQLITNNPGKVDGLRDYGIQVTKRIASVTSPNRHNIHYLRTKKQRAGHWLNVGDAPISASETPAEEPARAANE